MPYTASPDCSQRGKPSPSVKNEILANVAVCITMDLNRLLTIDSPDYDTHDTANHVLDKRCELLQETNTLLKGMNDEKIILSNASSTNNPVMAAHVFWGPDFMSSAASTCGTADSAAPCASSAQANPLLQSSASGLERGIADQLASRKVVQEQQSAAVSVAA
jgi:hypothetical protein